MMNSLAPELVRRGFQAHHSMKAVMSQDGGKGGEPKPQLPAWGGIILVATFILFIVAEFTVRLLNLPADRIVTDSLID